MYGKVKNRKIRSRTQRILSVFIYIANIGLLFFPWIQVGENQYHIFGLAVQMKKGDLTGVLIGVEIVLFVIFGIFCVAYIAAGLRKNSMIKYWICRRLHLATNCVRYVK